MLLGQHTVDPVLTSTLSIEFAMATECSASKRHTVHSECHYVIAALVWCAHYSEIVVFHAINIAQRTKMSTNSAYGNDLASRKIADFYSIALVAT